MKHINETFNDLDDWDVSIVPAGGNVELIDNEVKLSRNGTDDGGASVISHQTVDMSSLGDRWMVDVDLTDFNTSDSTDSDTFFFRINLWDNED